MDSFKLLKPYLIILLLLTETGLNAQHFTPVNTGNPYLPMNIIIDSAFLDNGLLQINDEIAVFDINGDGSAICVGQVSITSEFTSDTNYIINASADDPTTSEQDGFINGNEIIFRYWDSSKGREIILINKTFAPSLDDVYQTQGTAKSGLDGYSYETWTGNADTVWSNASNWSFNRIPSLQFDVIIPNTPTGNRFPVVSSQEAKCFNLTIEENATIKITGKLTIGEYPGIQF